MEKKTDYSANLFVADLLEQTWPDCIKASVNEYENYGINDIDLSAFTDNFLHYTYYPLESKTIKGGYNFFEDGVWRNYFMKDIYKKLLFNYGTILETGTPLYFVNAESKYKSDEGKWQKLISNNACLSFLAGDALIIFSPRALREAFKGYADYFVSHTTEFGRKEKRRPEKKALLDLSKGHIILCNPPKELLTK